jgi:hypothetical protein
VRGRGETVPEEPTCFWVHFSHARRAHDQSAAIGEEACAATGRQAAEAEKRRRDYLPEEKTQNGYGFLLGGSPSPAH